MYCKSSSEKKPRTGKLQNKIQRNPSKFNKVKLDLESEREKAVFCKRGKRKQELLKKNQSKLIFLLRRAD